MEEFHNLSMFLFVAAKSGDNHYFPDLFKGLREFILNGIDVYQVHDNSWYA